MLMLDLDIFMIIFF